MTSEIDKLSELLDSFNSEEEWLAYREAAVIRSQAKDLSAIDPNDDVPWDYDMKIF